MERLFHYSAMPLSGPLANSTDALPLGAKPRGLWLSVEDAWKEWCEDAGFGIERLACVAEITLRPDAKILRLSSADDIDTITARHPARLYPGDTTNHMLDWPAIGAEYDGIIIAPYQWSRRLSFETSWYYGWDCASGCIWYPRAVAAVRALVTL